MIDTRSTEIHVVAGWSSRLDLEASRLDRVNTQRHDTSSALALLHSSVRFKFSGLGTWKTQMTFLVVVQPRDVILLGPQRRLVQVTDTVPLQVSMCAYMPQAR